MKPKVLIAIPNGDSKIYKQVVFTVIKMLQDERVKAKLTMPSFRPTIECRHRVMYEFLEGDHDFLISIDSDNPPAKSLISLILLNLDIIGCPTPIWMGTKKGSNMPIYWNAMDKYPDGYRPHQPKNPNGIEEVDAVGTGCIIIARRVLEALKDSKPFDDQLDERGLRYRGHDFRFCEKAKEAGFKIYAHYGYLCLHFATLEMVNVMRSYHDYYTKDKK